MGINFGNTCSGCENKRTYCNISTLNVNHNNNETVILKNKDIQLPKEICHLLINNNKKTKKKNSRNKINYSSLSNVSTGHITNKRLIGNSQLSSPKNIIKYIPKNVKENACYIIDSSRNFGIYKSTNNSIKYVGYFDEDLKFTSFGNFRNYKNKTSYIGEFENSKANGYGIYNNSKNTIYEGVWENDIQIKIGIEIWDDNSFYKGEYLNGKKHGIGSYFWPDKSYYKGEWENNAINGYGIYVFNSNKIYRGEFKNNKFNGYGEFIHDSNHIYIGFFIKDKKEGFGIFIWNFLKNSDKKVYIGFWKNNKMNGFGKILFKNSSRFSLWKKGKKIKDFINFEECFKFNMSNSFYNECKNLENYSKLFMYSINDIDKLVNILIKENKIEIYGEEEKKTIKNKLEIIDSQASELFSNCDLQD